MATVDFISISLMDDSGDVKAVPVYFPSGMTLANIQAGVNALLPLVDAAVDGHIESVTLTKALTLPGGLKATAGGDIERGALLTFACANTVYKHGMFLPTVPDTEFSGDEAIVDTGALGSLVDAIVAGFGTGGNEVLPSDKYANDITAISTGVKRFRK